MHGVRTEQFQFYAQRKRWNVTLTDIVGKPTIS
jgi:hypothetical protein